MDESCNNCGGDEWTKFLETGQEGHKGGDRRDPTTKEVFECIRCGKEGRRFTDGVDGTVTLSGAFR